MSWRPGLLVSVRSAEEARQAVLGGASVVDVKEPSRGPLGRASLETWRDVREVVPDSIAVSVALGELTELDRGFEACPGIAFRKVGFARANLDWRERWTALRAASESGPSWVAVAYADWELAGAPHPSEVLRAAIEARECSGILVDTWDKTKPSPLKVTPQWKDWVASSKSKGLFVSLAGSLDADQITRLAPLEPDIFAVRGAACDGGSRDGSVKSEHVARLLQVIRQFRS